MRLIRGLQNVRKEHQGCALTIGNFDGMHLGHQQLFKDLQEKARVLKAPSVVMTFEPHPQEFLNPTKAPTRVTNIREKTEFLATQGVDYVLIVRFDKIFSELTADEFIEKILLNALQVRFLLIGDDFKFGFKRQGDFALLQTAPFETRAADTFYLNTERASSTRVRQALAQGRCEEVTKLLGRPYRITGRVVKGQQLGRKLGFPTVNIPLKRLASPIRGIFVVKVLGIGYGVASVGTRPTVGGQHELLEVFLLEEDNNKSLYGQLLRVEFLHYLRPEIHFDSLLALQEKIAQDVQDAKRFLNDRL